MSDLSFTLVREPEHIAELANFAEGIFREYFSTLHTPEKVDYLVNYLLGTETLTREIADEGYEFYFADDETGHVGFIAVQPREDEGYLFLSKLYLEAGQRGKGYGRKEFEFVKQRALDFGLPKIRLTVARDNEASIAKYKHMGFGIIDKVDNDVGGGVQMNDYVMEYVLP